MPRPPDQAMESTWMAAKPMSLASWALQAKVQVASLSVSS